mmetsp:Transcript_17130/g.29626  ORF Transcript_17130/g.29626 Transcript_17130/m.29626 type:complete len:202 (-) Transcript_17130:376-981(-)
MYCFGTGLHQQVSCYEQGQVQTASSQKPDDHTQVHYSKYGGRQRERLMPFFHSWPFAQSFPNNDRACHLAFLLVVISPRPSCYTPDLTATLRRPPHYTLHGNGSRNCTQVALANAHFVHSPGPIYHPSHCLTKHCDPYVPPSPAFPLSPFAHTRACINLSPCLRCLVRSSPSAQSRCSHPPLPSPPVPSIAADIPSMLRYP